MSFNDFLFDLFFECPPILLRLFKSRLKFYFLFLKCVYLGIKANNLRIKADRLLLQRGDLLFGVNKALLVDGGKGGFFKPIKDCHRALSPMPN